MTTTKHPQPDRDDDAAKRKRICVICSGRIIGPGHNAAPVAVGQCCDHCNAYIVLPKRWEKSQQEKQP
jgi:hypothetical protein